MRFNLQTAFKTMKCCGECFIFLPMVTSCVFICSFLELHRLLDPLQVLAEVGGGRWGGGGGKLVTFYLQEAQELFSHDTLCQHGNQGPMSDSFLEE